jgi:integrase
MKTRYFFHNLKGDEKEAVLFFRVRRGASPNYTVNMMVSTQTKVNVNKWEKALHDSKDTELTTYGKKIVPLLDKAYDTAISWLNGSDTDPKLIKREIFRVLNPDAIEAVKKALKRKEETENKTDEENAKAAEKATNDIVKVCDTFIKGIEAHTIMYTKKNAAHPYTEGSIKKWRTFREVLTEFAKEYPFTWKDINENFYLRWLTFLQRKGFMQMTQAKLHSCLKHLIVWHTGSRDAALPIKKSFDVNADLKAAEIYMNADEIRALYNMKLTGIKKKCRDLFLMGVCSCQRYSDYSTIEKNQFRRTEKGTEVIDFAQKKTGSTAIVPYKLIWENLPIWKIFDEYDFASPKMASQVFNRCIKDICKDLSKSVPSLSEMVPTVLTQKELARERKEIQEGKPGFYRDNKGRVFRPKYECVSSHSARRSGITLMFLSGKLSLDIMMLVSGHQSMKQFTEYVKLSNDEKIDDMAAKMHNDKQI